MVVKNNLCRFRVPEILSVHRTINLHKSNTNDIRSNLQSAGKLSATGTIISHDVEDVGASRYLAHINFDLNVFHRPCEL